MSEFRRKMMMANKSSEETWDYEWYPPKEMPFWLTKSQYVTLEEGDGYVRLYCATSPSNVVNRVFLIFDEDEFPTTNSYIVEMDIMDAASRLATSNQGGWGFFPVNSVNNGWCITRYLSQKFNPPFYRAGFKLDFTNSEITQIPDDMRYVIRFTFDNDANTLTSTTGGVTVSRQMVDGAPRRIYTRYSNGGYIDVYSIKVKRL